MYTYLQIHQNPQREEDYPSQGRQDVKERSSQHSKQGEYERSSNDGRIDSIVSNRSEDGSPAHLDRFIESVFVLRELLRLCLVYWREREVDAVWPMSASKRIAHSVHHRLRITTEFSKSTPCTVVVRFLVDSAASDSLLTVVDSEFVSSGEAAKTHSVIGPTALSPSSPPDREVGKSACNCPPGANIFFCELQPLFFPRSLFSLCFAVQSRVLTTQVSSRLALPHDRLIPVTMGNTPSKTPHGQSGPSVGGPSPQSNDSKVHRRRSIQAMSGGKASAADPSATKESATGQYANSQHTPVHQRLQSRAIPPETPTHRQEQRDSRRERGNYDAQASLNPPGKQKNPEPSRAVQVPPIERPAPQRGPVNTYYATSSHLARPPRLPLPIGDAMSTPGSPIGASGSPGATATFDNRNIEDTYHRTGSGDAVDDEEITDELEPYPMSGVNMAIPTTIEWHGDGEKVYVTGTFVNWARKFRLHKR